MLGPDYDAEIVEMHHRHKVDAPSGTALGLGRAIAEGRNVEFDAVAVLSREGQTGARRRRRDRLRHPARRRRGGGAHGDLRRTRRAAGADAQGRRPRSLFARGAVRAARWAYGKHPGLYGMTDVLGL